MAEKKKSAKKSVWKTCSRGHKYRGSRCPYCWKKDKEGANDRSKNAQAGIHGNQANHCTNV